MSDTTVKYNSADGEVELEVNNGPTGLVPVHDVRTSALPTGAATSALQTTGNTTLTSIVTSVNNVGGALDPGSGHTGQNVDIDTTSEPLGSQACTLGAWVKNTSTLAQKIYVNYAADGSATTTNGWELSAGDQHWFPCGNLSELNVIASADNAKAAWHAI